MSNNIAAFGDPTALTITLAGLVDAAYREATKVDNTVNKFLDALLEFSVTLPGAATGDKEIVIFGAVSLDGTTWPDVVTGVNAAITPGDERNLIRLGTFYCPSGNGPWRAVWPTAAGPWAALTLAPYWTLIVQNRTGQTLSAGTIRFVGTQIAEA